MNAAIRRAGEPPRGATVAIRGQIAAMAETFTNITAGLIVAVVVIFLLLAANFQSLRLAFVSWCRPFRRCWREWGSSSG